MNSDNNGTADILDMALVHARITAIQQQVAREAVITDTLLYTVWVLMCLVLAGFIIVQIRGMV